MPNQFPPSLKKRIGLVLVALATVQQFFAIRLEIQQNQIPQVILSSMVLASLLALGASTAWRRISVNTMRPFILWFASVWFLLYAFLTWKATEPIENPFYNTHFFLIAACFVLLPLRSAALISTLSAAVLLFVGLSHPQNDLQRLLSTIFVGLLISFLTVYGESIRAEFISSPSGPGLQQDTVRQRLRELMGWKQLPPERSAFMLLEIETLENIKDVHGPQVASQAMERLERSLRMTLPGGDYVWRYGDRFLLLLTNTDPQMAENLGRTLTEQSNLLEAVRGEKLRVSAALAFLNEKPTVDDTIKLAHRRLYAARRQGSGQFLSAQTQVNRAS